MPFDVSVTLPFDAIHAPEEFISLDAVRDISPITRCPRIAGSMAAATMPRIHSSCCR